MARISFFFLIVSMFSLVSCTREKVQKFKLTGRLLNSTSNPLPVANYPMKIVQADLGTLLGNADGIEKTFVTNSLGEFSVIYTEAGKSDGLFQSGGSTNPITLIAGNDANNYSSWSNISPFKDTSLNNVYLHKKINVVAIRLSLLTALSSVDTVRIYIDDQVRQKTMNVTGPAAAGSLLLIDTMQNVILRRMNIRERNYLLTVNARHKNRLIIKDFNLPPGDELRQELEIRW